jgi:hypothetical protein
MEFTPDTEDQVPQDPIHGLCPYCGLDLPAMNAMGVVGFGPQGSGVLFGCDCGMSMVILLNPHEYAEFLMDVSASPILREVWFDQYGELDDAVLLSDEPVEESVQVVKEMFRPKEGPPLEQLEGRLVKGWQVELDEVTSLEDLRLHWSYQEQVEPQSVVREHCVGGHWTHVRGRTL